jgi:membrane protein DedA with SNARE-associated domain
LVVVGYLFGDNLSEIQQVVGRIEYVIIGAIVLFAVISLVVSRVRARREARIIAEAAQRAQE